VRVLLVNHASQEAGGEDGVFQAERTLLLERGHPLAVYQTTNRAIEDHGPVRRASLSLRSAWARDGRRDLAALLARERPDVAHFHDTFPLISPAAYGVCRRAGVPVVQTLHDYRLVCPAVTLSRAGRVCTECPDHSLWRGVRHGCYRGSRLATAVVAGGLAVHRARGSFERGVDVYVAPTEFSRAALCGAGLPADRIAVKPNFLAHDPGLRRGDGAYALFLGRLSQERGVGTLLEAWRRLGGEVPLRIAGEGPLAPEVAAAAAKLPGVECLGGLDREKRLEVLRGARFLVVPSVWYEGFPMSVVEAYACGVPVLASRIGSLAEVVDDLCTGTLVAPGDPDAFARAASHLWGDRQAARRRGAQGRAAFERHYTAERNYELLMAVYERAVIAHREERRMQA
jgi:glycosyltransferase involved in cell wall biosynthesis